MTLIRRSSPFGEPLSLRQAMDRLFEDSFARPRGANTARETGVPLDMYATPTSLVSDGSPIVQSTRDDG